MRNCYAALLSVFIFANGLAQPAITYQPFLSGLTAPIEVVNAGDGSNRLFIVQQNGVVRVYDPANGGLQATDFLNISSLVTYSGEQGLLSLAFHPEYESNGYFFVYYNNTSGDVTVSRYSVSANPNIAKAGSDTVLLTIAKPFTNHNGGHLQFGKDGNLYFATGDGGSGNDPNNNAQNGLSLLGKMIRINVDSFSKAPYYTVPATNPFVGNASYDSRIWALGLRNPFRWSFDRLTGDMWIGDVGQNTKEEVDFTPASSTGGENYGWRCYEGTIRTPGVTPCDPVNYHPPVFDYDNPAGGSSSVIGGYVYRGSEYPFFQGYYIAADAYSGTAYLIKPNGSGGWVVTQQTGLPNVVSFGEAENGSLYAVSQGNSAVYKVAATGGSLPLVLAGFSAVATANGTEVKWTTSFEQGRPTFIVEFGPDGRYFTKAGEVLANGNPAGASYSFAHVFSSATPLFYRLQIADADGSRRYSSVVKIEGKRRGLQVYPSVVRNGRFYLNSDVPVEKLQVVNSNGSLLLEKRLVNSNLPVAIQLPAMARGIYIVRVFGPLSGSYKILVE